MQRKPTIPNKTKTGVQQSLYHVNNSILRTKVIDDEGIIKYSKLS